MSARTTLRIQASESLPDARRSYAVVVKETMTHTVYVHARTAAEAREKGKDSGNWYDDKCDFTQDAPHVVRSVKRDDL